LRFAHSVSAARAPADPRIGIYRHNIEYNVRNALAATYRVTRTHVGAAFFDAAADAFAAASPPCCGDLNVFGADFASFLAHYPPAAWLPYLPDVARLEWALDEAARAGDAKATAQEVLQDLARHFLLHGDVALSLHPSCRLLVSRHAAMRIWQARQAQSAASVDREAGGEWLLVRREGARPCVERLGRAEHAWLEALAQGSMLEAATSIALRRDAAFDVAAALHARIGEGTIAGVR
jgi:hypothetical protein